MNFMCPICSNVEDFCIMEPCKSCHHKLQQGVIKLDDFNETVEAEATVHIGIYEINGNSRSVTIFKQYAYSAWRRKTVGAVMIGIANFVGMDEKLLERFISTGDWSRLEKAKVFL